MQDVAQGAEYLAASEDLGRYAAPFAQSRCLWRQWVSLGESSMKESGTEGNKAVGKYWWITFLRGIFALLLGLALFVQPDTTQLVD